MTEKMMDKAALAAYYAEVAAADADLEKARATAKAAYDEATAPAEAAYQKARAKALAVYAKAIAPQPEGTEDD